VGAQEESVPQLLVLLRSSSNFPAIPLSRFSSSSAKVKPMLAKILNQTKRCISCTMLYSREFTD